MSWELSTKGEGSSIPLLADDMYDAVCVGVVDLGTQEQTWEGETKHVPQVVVSWAIHGETVDIDGEQKPRIVSKLYTASLGKRANLRKDLEGWRGKAFDTVESFDISALIGKSCWLLVGTSSTGKSNKVEAIKTKKIDVPVPAEIGTTFFRIQDWDGRTPLDPIYNWMQELIKKSPEYQTRESEAKARQAAPVEPQPVSEINEDDLPF